MQQYILFLTGFKNAYVSVRKEVLHNTLTQFVITMKLVRLIRMCLYETCGAVRIAKHFHRAFPVQNGHKHGGTFITITFQLHFRIRVCH